MRIELGKSTKKCAYFQMKKTETQRGGKRKGAGRPPEGKGRYTVTLDADNVKRAKKRAKNFSGLLDRLLADFLA